MRRLLSPAELRFRVPPGTFTFASTEEVEPHDDLVGQDVAIAALKRALELEGPGFNVFATGVPGAGRLGTVARALEALGPRRRGARDLVYVANFREPSRPRLLELPAGKGGAFKKDVNRAAIRLLQELPQRLQDSELRKARDEQEHEAAVAWHAGLARAGTLATELGFLIGEAPPDEEGDPPEHVVLWVDKRVPEDQDGHLRSRAELEALLREKKLTLDDPDAVRQGFERVEEALEAARSGTEAIVRRSVAGIAEAESEAMEQVVEKAFGGLHRRHPAARTWLKELREWILEAVDWRDDEADHSALEAAFNVNVIHAGKARGPAPVVLVPWPSWRHLFGGVEGDVGDHRSLRAGSLLDADGGWLVASAADLVSDPATWRTLLRALTYEQVEIGNPDTALGGPGVLRPEPVPLDVRVVLVGDAEVYGALWDGDPDFPGVFKVKAEFSDNVPATTEAMNAYAGVLSRLVRRERLPPLERGAVEAVLEESARSAGGRNRLDADLGHLADLVREAATGAGRRVARKDVDTARENRRRRSDLAERDLLRLTREGVIRVDMHTPRVGQVFALGVLRSGSLAFGHVLRVSAVVGAGRAGVVSIEREVDLSGPSHDKGVRTLQGYLLGRYGRKRRLSFSASLAFEQLHEPIDGDSASVAEAVALISALARLPVRADVAVTGAMDQMGAVMAVGGVNEKVEGFFMTAHALAAPSPSVLIPSSIAAELCLDPALVRAGVAVEVYDELDDALERMLGRPVEQIHEAVEKALDELASVPRSVR